MLANVGYTMQKCLPMSKLKFKRVSPVYIESNHRFQVIIAILCEISPLPYYLCTCILNYCGLLSIVMPARNAAKMNPVDALRFEHYMKNMENTSIKNIA
jgi:ABC-type lipoprotein release transport system permease subunit